MLGPHCISHTMASALTHQFAGLKVRTCALHISGRGAWSVGGEFRPLNSHPWTRFCGRLAQCVAWNDPYRPLVDVRRPLGSPRAAAGENGHIDVGLPRPCPRRSLSPRPVVVRPRASIAAMHAFYSHITAALPHPASLARSPTTDAPTLPICSSRRRSGPRSRPAVACRS